MSSPAWSESFLASTRGRVLMALRAGAATVEELAQAMELTDNAIRAHLTSLERDGLISALGPRRDGAVGKPANVYVVTAAAETALSKAYAPVLAALLASISERMSPREMKALMRDVGRRLAPPDSALSPTASVHARAEAASALLNALGGVTTVERAGSDYVVRGASCPLSVAVSARPEVCEAVRTMLTDVTGAAVTECCARGERNQCSFAISASRAISG